MRLRLRARAAVLLPALVLLAALPACNDNSTFVPRNAGTVIVHVVDTGGAGVVDALVRLQLRTGFGGTIFVDGRTKPDGSYTYTGVEAGLCPVSVTPPDGYTSTEPLFKTLSVAGGDTTETTFVLKKS